MRNLYRNLQECLKLNPNHPEANFNLGIILGKRGNAKADEYVKKAARLGDPYVQEMWNNGGFGSNLKYDGDIYI